HPATLQPDTASELTIQDTRQRTVTSCDLAPDAARAARPRPVGKTVPAAADRRLMDPRQHELARIALAAVGNRGFVLGGGHAVALHGMGSRPSEAVDLFSDVRGTPGEVADDVISAFESAGLTVDVVRRTPDLVQMTVTFPDEHAAKVDLGVFWRARSPVLLEVGPVLHPDDAVAGKMDALFNRWAPRDYLDIDAILVSGRYTREQLYSRSPPNTIPDSTGACSPSLCPTCDGCPTETSLPTRSPPTPSQRCGSASQTGNKS
ncbi:nucleotidyl transferase AbiEii/AbiGii toxin family protein, partial [Nocardia seriolae]